MLAKRILFLFFLSLNLSAFAQSPEELIKERKENLERTMREYNKGTVDTAHRFFYKTYDDYLAHKPAAGITYTGERKILFDTESILVSTEEDFVSKKIKELKYWGFIDEWGQLQRIFNNHCYFALDSGKICSYVRAMDVSMTTDKYGAVKFSQITDNSTGYKDYLSETLNGSIIDFNEKKFESLISSHPEIFEQYKKEETDSKSNTRISKTQRIQKYTKMYNDTDRN